MRVRSSRHSPSSHTPCLAYFGSREHSLQEYHGTKVTMQATNAPINLLPRYARESEIAATRDWKTRHRMLAFKWLLRVSRCQNMRERHGLNMPEIAQPTVVLQETS